MAKKGTRLVFALLLVACMGGSFFWMTGNSFREEKGLASDMAAGAARHKSEQKVNHWTSEAGGPGQAIRGKPDVVETAGPMPLSEADIHEIVLWDERMGYFPEEMEQAYRAYGLEALSDLADAGDVLAIQTLAMEYLALGDREMALWAYRDAAARGSTHALLMAAIIERQALTGTDSADPGWTAAVVEAFALYEVADRRGDRSVASVRRAVKGVHDIELSADLARNIEQRANALYQSLLEQRQALGLGDFDNDVPPAAQQLRDASHLDY